MKNLPELKGIPDGKLEKAIIPYSGHQPERSYVSDEEALESLADELFSVSLSTGPVTSISPEIDPEDIESVFLWFLS